LTADSITFALVQLPLTKLKHSSQVVNSFKMYLWGHQLIRFSE